MKPRALLVLMISCGPAASAPTIDVPRAVPVPVVAVQPRPLPADRMAEWHWRKPKPEAGQTENGKPLYLAVASQRTVTSNGCRLVKSTKGRLYVLCDHDIGRIEGAKLDFAWGKTVPLKGYGANAVREDGDRLWVHGWSGSDGAYDPFFGTDGVLAVEQNGKWQQFDNDTMPDAYTGGALLLTTLPVKTDDSCPDASCSGILPTFATFGTKQKPDFSALAGKIEWIHPQSIGRDFGIAVDPDGPVYVLMRSMDPKTKKRGFGIASWTPKDGAKFQWLPAPLGTTGTGDAWSNSATASNGTATIDMTIDAHPKSATYYATFDGKKWKVGLDAPKSGVATPTVEPFDPGARVVVEVSANDVWVDDAGSIFRTVQPDEVFVQTERWGRVHSFAPPADDDCRTPFAVLDRLEKDRYSEMVDKADGSWGVVEEKYAHAVVKMETEELVVIGVPFETTADARGFLERTQWTNYRDGMFTPHAVVCARPVAPVPFTLPKK